MYLPVLSIVLAAIIWGIWWIPIRALADLGLGGIWAGTAMAAGAFLLLGAWAAWRREPLRTDHRSAIGAALVGVSFTLYSAALNETEVVRATLLFYLSPAWSKVIEWAFMGRRWHPASTLTLTLAFLGAFLITGADVSFADFGAGDALALGSGVSWAVAAALVFSGGKTSTTSLCLWSLIAAIVGGALFGLAGDLPNMVDPVPRTLGIALFLGALFVTPMLAMTLWSAERLPPSLLTFLLTFEIITGVATAVMFLDETFGLLQLAGTVIIILAVISEVLMMYREERAPGQA